MASSRDELKERVKELRGMLKSDVPENQVRCEVEKLLTYCRSYYEGPNRYGNSDAVLRIISGRNLSPLESAFMWLGAWRPSAAISLVFSVMGVTKQGIQIEIPANALQQSEKLTSLTAEQISELKSYRDQASGAEKELTEELATIQMMLPDQEVVTCLMSEDGGGDTSSKLKEMMEAKVCSLRNVLMRADQLRIKAMLQLSSALLPVQAAHCAIAAFEVAYVMKSISSATPASTS